MNDLFHHSNNISLNIVDTDENPLVRWQRVMGQRVLVGLKEPYLYDSKTKEKIGYINSDLSIKWFIS